ncbi:hypothetical protein ACGYLI_00095 [Sulfitobacter sp. 1A13421]|uniref:hypothetical protein n=1 Tax=Sulfitobacter sp. 1A13421 TaxID=3368595 RepID=UPI003744FA0F
MAAKPRTNAYKRQYREAIVGWHRQSNSPKVIYIQNDGGMSGDNLTHHPIGGRSAEGEAVVVFHLSQVRTFGIQDETGRNEYIAELRRENSSE